MLKALESSPNQRISNLANMVKTYIKKEYSKLSDTNKTWHISSDVIESLFGDYKEGKSPNKMNGVTKQIFILPLLTQLQRKIKVDGNAFKIYLEKIQLKDLDTWKNGHLSENRTVKRRKILSLNKAAG
jgi:hypothetical protein